MDAPSPPPGPWHRHVEGRPRVAIGLLAACLVLQVGWWWRPTDDSCSYLSIARSLLRGEPANLGDPHLYYAPGYPALLAPAFLLGDRPFLAISLVHLVLAASLVGGTVLWSRRIFPSAPLALPALVGVNVGVWAYQRLFLSEIPFAAAAMAAAMCFDRALAARGGPPALRWTLAGALLSAGAAALRAVGVVVPAAFALVAFARCRGARGAWARALAAGVVAAAPATATVLAIVAADHARAGPGAPTYVGAGLEGWGAWPERVAEGLRLRTAEVGRLVVPGAFKAYAPAGVWGHPATLLHLAASAVVAVGAWRLLRRTGSVLVAALPLYALVYVLWPFDQGARFLAPLVPALLACVLEVLLARPRAAALALPALVALHLVASLAGWVHELAPRSGDVRRLSPPQLHADWPDLERLAARVGADRARVAASGADRAHVLLLQYLLDRPVEDARREAVSPGARWLLLGPEEAVPAGFIASGLAGRGWTAAFRAPP